jgi:hypothetical protein
MNELNDDVGEEADKVVVKDSVVGVTASSDSADSVRSGTGLRGGSARGAWDPKESGEGGIVLSLLTEEGDPLGRRMEVSNDASGASSKLSVKAEGEGLRNDDSYEPSVDAAQRSGLGGGGLDDVPLMVDKSRGEDKVDSEMLGA